MKIGDKIKLVFPDQSSIVVEVMGMDFRMPYNILVDIGEDVPMGTEVWLIGTSISY